MRSVLVTGGARGIGAAVAACYREAGFAVLAPSRSELDLASPQSVEAYLSLLTTDIDVLINNAGQNVIRGISDVVDGDWNEMLAVNLSAPMRLTRALAPRMARRGWGRIVNVASIYGVVSRAGRSVYSATKSGLIGFTRATAIEFGPGGVLANAVCPGFVDTELTRRNNTPAQIAALCERVPVRRMADPAEIAKFIAYLGSDENTYISGQSVVIDGGLLAQ